MTLQPRSFIAALCLLCLFPLRMWGEEGAGQPGTVMHANMLGIGGARQFDSYLSPMEYRGLQALFMHESMRMTRMARGRISFQQRWQAGFSYTDNPAGNAEDYGGSLSWNGGWHHHWTPLPNLRLMAGGLLGAHVGVLYNTRNGNNPAQGRGAIDLSASVAAIYRLRLGRLPLRLRYQADLPLLGGMFSPHYGESYYEIGQHGGGHILFSHPGNALSLCQLFTVDLPVGRCTLRVGYLSDIRQSHVRDIRVKEQSRSFLIGVVRHFSIISGRQTAASNKTIL